MKRYLLILLVACTGLGSCKKDFLDLLPEGSIPPENYFKNTEEFQQALTGAYVPLRDIANIAFFMDEMRSDNTHYDYNAQDRGGIGYEQLADFMDDAGNSVINTRYAAAFNGISRTNVILDRLETIQFEMAEEDRKKITGEAKALRAHYYFDLIRHFGPVPLHLHEVRTSEQAFRPRSTSDSIYNQIIADFTEAINSLAPPAGFPSYGRFNKGSASTELALVYMTRKQFDLAVPLLQDVTTMGYDLWPAYKDAFNPANESNAMNKESILEVGYKSGTDGQSSQFIYRFLPLTVDLAPIIGFSYNNVNGGWNTPTQDLIDTYEDGDARLPASINILEGRIRSGDTGWLPDKVITDITSYTPPAGTTPKVFVSKYFFPPYTAPGYNTDQNWPVFRFAGVLLWLAESLNESGRPGDALAPLNRVRKRAGLDPVNAGDPGSLRTIIANEQRVELAFENYRWLDLVRTDKAIEVMTTHGEEMKSLYSYLLPGSYNVNANKLIYAIPLREVTLNKLDQNEGY
ncbi:RagB/SusD family nutrient uptake outer membrane protein [Pseudobacter ginsenosidimutans]|uniref:Putative outer membrane starch-binding protein n=1 Tax=Pseudobacter ginsenosidimutans TaxID=661488 RepID=A0A4Q7N4V0_9BACT|nr:RagB/SusD family nutrient uptake outer membrane protein [Pseudobacter ginsenosidimutans]QEC44560.1 RagB/SusD family nutrient uptake outer membrane protein [Pseudobacter ginsenosidimutans]RZS76038.1 putative outer membrane starch-binding protein [Pseudobacter ginsenosidimutans]